MAIRTGSLSRELAQCEPDILALILEDYKVAQRRDRASRMDFAMGWLAAMRRLGKTRKDTQEMPSNRLPW